MLRRSYTITTILPPHLAITLFTVLLSRHITNISEKAPFTAIAELACYSEVAPLLYYGQRYAATPLSSLCLLPGLLC